MPPNYLSYQMNADKFEATNNLYNPEVPTESDKYLFFYILDKMSKTEIAR